MDQMNQNIDALNKELKKVTNQIVRHVGWSRHMGQSLGIYFGDRYKYKEVSPLAINRVSEVNRLYGYSHNLASVGSSWRIQSMGKVIRSWRDQVWIDSGEFKGILKMLEGGRIEHIELRTPTLDLTVLISNGFQIELFCDCIMDPNDGDCDYTFSTGNTCYIVGPGGKIRCEEDGILDLSCPLITDE